MFLINEIKGLWRGYRLQHKANKLINEHLNMLIDKELF